MSKLVTGKHSAALSKTFASGAAETTPEQKEEWISTCILKNLKEHNR